MLGAAVDRLTSLENAIGAELLRTRLLRAPKPRLDDRFVIEAFLGRGASGLVVRATDERLARVVALKLAFAEGDGAVPREARALASLDHPNVVRVHDVDFVRATFDGSTFELWVVSMQLVPGSTMREWWVVGSPTNDQIVKAFVDAGRGLAAAHANGIVHRDFKPDNVIVRADGSAQVLDFGFAVPALSAFSNLGTSHGDAAGTGPYMAREACLGRAGRRSDQFAFGVSLVEALTGDPTPARGETPEGLSPRIWAVLCRATAEDEDDRFDSMDELLRELTAVTTPPPRARASARILLVAAAILLALVAAVYVRLSQPLVWHLVRGRIERAVSGIRDAPSRAVLAVADAGTPGDAGASSILDAGGGISDAGTDAATCVELVGAYDLTTHMTSARPGLALYGAYELVLGERPTLTKTGFGVASPDERTLRQPLTVVRVTVEEGCEHVVVSSLGERGYVFRLREVRGELVGRFSAEGDSRGSFEGTVRGAPRNP